MNRVQTLRSSITGDRPAVGTRQPGELYVNWADLAFGTINTTQAPVDLVAVRYWSVAANYSAGSHVIYNGLLYYALVSITAGAFNPVQWAPVSGASGIPEAPTNDQLYGRKNAAWVVVPGGGGVPEAPTDGQQYGRQAVLGVPSWTVVATGGGIPDAPTGGAAYARKNPGGWSLIAHTDVTDWVATLAPYALLASPTFTGTPSLPTGTIGITQTPTDNTTKLATTAFVSAAVAGISSANPNRLDNGNMAINERARTNTFPMAVAANNSVYAADRWFAFATKAQFSAGRNYGITSTPSGFPYTFGVQCTSSTATVAADAFVVGQSIEADMLNDVFFASGLQPITLSFWACAAGSGAHLSFPAQFSGSVTDGVSSRSYVFTFTLTSASAWQHFVITIPGDSGGSNWNVKGSNIGMYVYFDLGTGTTSRTGTTGSWIPGSFVGKTGAAGIMAHSGNQFAFTGVKLESGTTATAWVAEPPAIQLERCQRYYVNMPGMGLIGDASTVGEFMYSLIIPPTQMAYTPDAVLFNNVTNLGGTTGVMTSDGPNINSALVHTASTSTGQVAILFGIEIICENF